MVSYVDWMGKKRVRNYKKLTKITSLCLLYFARTYIFLTLVYQHFNGVPAYNCSVQFPVVLTKSLPYLSIPSKVLVGIRCFLSFSLCASYALENCLLSQKFPLTQNTANRQLSPIPHSQVLSKLQKGTCSKQQINNQLLSHCCF